MMKTIQNFLFIAMLAVLNFGQAQAQEYLPFVREGVKWVCYYDKNFSYPGYDDYFGPGKTFFTLEIKGEETIDGKVYKKMHKYGGKAINEEDDTVLVYLREEDKVVYGICPDGNIGYIIGFGPQAISPIYSLAYSGQEFPLYDFNDPETLCSTVCRHYLDRGFEYMGIEDYQLGGGKNTRCHSFLIYHRYHVYLIEGIGADAEDDYRYVHDMLAGCYKSAYPLNYMVLGEVAPPPFFLNHVIENGKVIYKGIHYDNSIESDVNFWPVKGDVNEDGEVNIEDITLLIGIVLNQSGSFNNPADVDGSGDVDVMDVTALIEYVLSH